MKTDKLRDVFDEMTVYKDLRKSNFLAALTLPSFMRDWLLRKFEDDDGTFDTDELAGFVREFLPRKDEWTAIKNRLIFEHDKVRILARIVIDIDIKTGGVSFALPDFAVTSKSTVVEDYVWRGCKDELLCGHETWGMVELGYRAPDDGDYGDDKPRKPKEGKVKLVSFKPFCPYVINLDYFQDARNKFTVDEWVDLLLGAIDYNADGYSSLEQKLTMLTRLLPFVEKRLNLIELAPKGTGKSYLYGQVSRFGWLVSGGVMSRAKLFYDLSKRTEGLIASNDFVVLDEVQSVKFPDELEMRGVLKGYLENGVFNVGNYEGVADAGLILAGNIRQETMDLDGRGNMFTELPGFFHESALIDRLHGFIKGWNIPRMHDDLKVSGWALNSEYFTAIMHELRGDIGYRAVVDELVAVPERSDTRDTEAVKRIATAYLKLLFPNVRKAADITPEDFQTYCLARAVDMRGLIKRQLGLLDPAEFAGKALPAFTVRT